MEIIRRHVMRKSNFREMKEEFRKVVGDDVDKLFQKSAELIITEESELYAENKIVLAFKYNENILPSLQALNKDLVKLPTITVDMGAVPYVTNGADIMAPGITKISDGLNAGDFIMIIDEKFGKVLAVGQLLYSGKEIKEMKKGKAVKNIHFVNDEIWKLEL